METPAVEKDEIICQCFQVSESTIRSCIEAKNISSVEEVTKACEAGGGCHSCHILLQMFIDEHQEKKSSPQVVISGQSGKVKKNGIFSRLFSRAK